MEKVVITLDPKDKGIIALVEVPKHMFSTSGWLWALGDCEQLLKDPGVVRHAGSVFADLSSVPYQGPIVGRELLEALVGEDEVRPDCYVEVVD